MNLLITFLLNTSGLFDFDLTFIIEGILFLILSLIVTFNFLAPISSKLRERLELIDFNSYKSSFLITYAYNELSTYVELLTEELNELNRQLKFIRTYTNIVFENEIIIVQNKNKKLINKLKGDLAIKSGFFLTNMTKNLFLITDSFFIKNFK
jgi:hypothetical protein